MSACLGKMGPGKMGKLPEHVPFFTNFPPIFLHFSLFLEQFHTFSMMYL